MDGFQSFGLSYPVLRGIEEAGFKQPSPIQREAIPVVLSGRDVIGQAHTGTGKTAAFGLPGLSRLQHNGKVEMLIITPTRELTTQVGEEIFKLGRYIPVKTVAVYGGQPYGRQIESLRRGPQVVVATPGRLLDLLEGGRLGDVMSPSLVVLDEADEMLDMGFLEDVEKIFNLLLPPGERAGSAPDGSGRRQTLLFSATMPKPIQDLANRFLHDPVTVRVLDPGARGGASSDVKQLYYVIEEHERDDATVRLMDSLEPTRAIVFCRTKREVDRLAGALTTRGIAAQPLHGDMEQPMRERAISSFRSGDFLALVATDVAARGLDIADVSHVFNYHVPFDPESYVHRVGRTGRAGRKGVAVTLVTPHEYHQLRRMQSRVGQMENRLIPTHQEIRLASEQRLLEDLRTQHVEGPTDSILQAIEEEMGLAEAARRMLSLLLSREEVSGPDRIGVQGDRLKRLHEPGRPQSRPGTGGRPGGRPSYGKPSYGKRRGPDEREGGGGHASQGRTGGKPGPASKGKPAGQKPAGRKKY